MSDRQQAFIRLPLPAGGELDGYLSYQDDPGLDAVLYVHGFGSTRGGTKAGALEAACVRHGWPFAAFDFRGHGRSGGSLLDLRGTGLLADLLRSPTTSPRAASAGFFPLVPAWAVGPRPGSRSERGTETVPAVALVAPAVRVMRRRCEALSPPEQEAWRQTGRLRVLNQWVDMEIGYGVIEEMGRFDPNGLADRWATPLLVYHGLADDTVPAADTLAFVERATFPDIEVRLLKGGDHQLLPYKDELADELCRFFGRWRQGKASAG